MAQEYVGNSIEVLEGLEAVRKRPGMYVGNVHDGGGLHHLAWEALDNAVDEHLGGHAMHIAVDIEPDGVMRVIDDGRGIPVDMHTGKGVSALQLVMTSLHAGGKFNHNSYEQSAGLHGVGISAVNAVSEWLEVHVHRDGHAWMQRYEFGIPACPVLCMRKLKKGEETGTRVEWKRDLSIFSEVTEYDWGVLNNRIQELAFLNPGLEITFTDNRGKKPKVVIYRYEGGIKQYVEDLVSKRKPLFEVLHFREFLKRSGAEVALTWTDAGSEDVRCFANNTANSDGGTHLTGFRNGITKVIGNYIREHELGKSLEDGVQGEDIRMGLVAVVNVRIPDISFSSQTKEKLVTTAARKLVEDLLNEFLAGWMEKNTAVAKKIADRAVLNAKAREAAKKAREGVLRKNEMDIMSLPGKLADCQSKDPSESEIFIVEGESAGGSAKGGRDRRFQAILPLRGKVLNVERASLEQVLDNIELGTLICALGCGTEATNNFNIKKLRYHKVVLMTDADVDGAHIRTLLLTFLYRYTPRLVHEGYVYKAVPPLYRVKKGAHERFFPDDPSMDAYFRELGFSRSEVEHRGYRITRYKGLGEMNPETLWATTMDPEVRLLEQVTVDDALAAEHLFELLMGLDVEARREYIEMNGGTVSGSLDI